MHKYGKGTRVNNDKIIHYLTVYKYFEPAEIFKSAKGYRARVNYNLGMIETN